MIAEPEGSALLIPRSAIWHDTEPVCVLYIMQNWNLA